MININRVCLNKRIFKGDIENEIKSIGTCQQGTVGRERI